MQHQQGLLIGRLDRHEPHRWACHGLTDGGCVGSIVFRPSDIALHVARRHQAHGVTELGDFTCPMMSGSAGFHADQARGNLAKEVNDLLAPQLTSDDDLARTIHGFNAELAQKSKSLACINKTSALTVGRDRPSVPSDGQADCLSVSCVKRRRTEVTVSSNGSQRPSVGKNPL
jgi:hypothetical protein